MSDKIENEIQKMFDDELSGYTGLAAGDNFKMSFSSSSIASQVSTLGELFAEYFLHDPAETNDINTFLKNNQLDDIITENQFMQVMCGEACLPQEALEFFRLKLPFEISQNKMHYLNVKAKRNVPNIEVLDLPKDKMLQFSSSVRKQKIEESRKRQNLSRIKYNRSH